MHSKSHQQRTSHLGEDVNNNKFIIIIVLKCAFLNATKIVITESGVSSNGIVNYFCVLVCMFESLFNAGFDFDATTFINKLQSSIIGQ